METTLKIQKSKILVVEGKDEELFFQALLSYLDLTDIQILPVGGKSRLAANIKAVKNLPDFGSVSVLAVIRDADSNAQGAFQSVKDALSKASLPCPTNLGQLFGSAPAVMVELFPGGFAPGMLEDLCVLSVSSTPLMVCVQNYFSCAQQHGIPLPQNLAKAKAHSFLALQAEPGKRVGEAALTGNWPFDNPAFDRIKAFLRSL